jgi:predicted DNA-binding protein (MmcQ/YjbR family)
MSRAKLPTDAVLKELRAFGLAYPGAHTKSPWPGHLDLAVNDKTFAYLSLEGEPLGISCKLPHSSEAALLLPFVSPAAWGLGKSGWVAARFATGQPVPVEMLKAWIDESYRAQAPKKLLASLAARPQPSAANEIGAPAKPRSAVKKKTNKKASAASAAKSARPRRPVKRRSRP